MWVWHSGEKKIKVKILREEVRRSLLAAYPTCEHQPWLSIWDRWWPNRLSDSATNISVYSRNGGLYGGGVYPCEYGGIFRVRQDIWRQQGLSTPTVIVSHRAKDETPSIDAEEEGQARQGEAQCDSDPQDIFQSCRSLEIWESTSRWWVGWSAQKCLYLKLLRCWRIRWHFRRMAPSRT